MFKFVQPTIKSVEIISNIIESGVDLNDDLDHLLSYYSIINSGIYNSVSVNSQRILNIISNSEEEMTVPDIREASGLTSGILTPYLKSLKEKGIITKDSSVKRNTKYFIKDPLFRLWLKRETL